MSLTLNYRCKQPTHTSIFMKATGWFATWWSATSLTWIGNSARWGLILISGCIVGTWPGRLQEHPHQGVPIRYTCLLQIMHLPFYCRRHLRIHNYRISQCQHCIINNPRNPHTTSNRWSAHFILLLSYAISTHHGPHCLLTPNRYSHHIVSVSCFPLTICAFSAHHDPHHLLPPKRYFHHIVFLSIMLSIHHFLIPPFVFLDFYITCCRLNWIINSIYYYNVHISKWLKQSIANILPIDRTQSHRSELLRSGGPGQRPWFTDSIACSPILSSLNQDQNTNSETEIPIQRPCGLTDSQATTTCQEMGCHQFSDPPTACSLNWCEYPQWFIGSIIALRGSYTL